MRMSLINNSKVNEKTLTIVKDKENNTVESNVNKKTLTIASQEVHCKHLNEKKRRADLTTVLVNELQETHEACSLL